VPQRRRKDRKTERAIGERLARLRKASGLTQAELANRLGVPQPNISYYESGQVRMYADMLAQIARTLGVSADDILGIQQRKASANGHPSTRPALRRMIEQLERLPQRHRQALFHTIRLYIQQNAG
jgi:transcriptional regulator with XRE-family HTH domain